MAVSSSTASNLVIGAGDVFLDGSDVGATMDANTFGINTEYTVPELNGIPGELMGTRYRKRESVSLGVSIVEITGTKLVAVWPNSSSATVGTITTVDTDDRRRLATTDYHDWLLQVDGLDQVQYNFYADNAVRDGDLEFEASDDGVMSYRAEVMATWDGADLTASPYRISRTTGVSS